MNQSFVEFITRNKDYEGMFTSNFQGCYISVKITDISNIEHKYFGFKQRIYQFLRLTSTIEALKGQNVEISYDELSIKENGSILLKVDVNIF